MADFAPGRIEDLRHRYGPEIARGIQQHREVDRFTDTHDAVRHSAACLQPTHGIFSGIIVDVCYDHFLLNHWTTFSTVPLDTFIESVHESLSQNYGSFPLIYRYVIPRLIKGQWLLSYRTLSGVQTALTRISYRFSRKTTLEQSAATIQAHYAELEHDFLRFFPEVIEFVRTL